MNDRIFGYAGLAKKAGLLSDGTESVVTNIRAGKAKLVLLASNASPATAKKINDKCGYYNVTAVVYGTMETLGGAVGRNKSACVSFNDGKFADAVLKLLK